METPYTHRYVVTNSINLHVVQAGPTDGPLVILLHGFPEFWYGWRNQIPHLAEQGYWVWVPDQRGYNLSDKPPAVNDYAMPSLAADVLGLLEAAGREQAFLVGHDWGAVVAWYLAMHHPERWRHVHILNVPHPGVMDRAVRFSPAQIRKSWYVYFFQFPWLPEWAARRHNWQTLADVMRRCAHPASVTDEVLDHYRVAWSQPGAFSAMLNWYRAAVRTALLRPWPQTRVRIPLHIIWGQQDEALGLALVRPSLALCDAGQLTLYPDATHWVQHDRAGDVNQLLTLDLARWRS